MSMIASSSEPGTAYERTEVAERLGRFRAARKIDVLARFGGSKSPKVEQDCEGDEKQGAKLSRRDSGCNLDDLGTLLAGSVLVM